MKVNFNRILCLTALAALTVQARATTDSVPGAAPAARVTAAERVMEHESGLWQAAAPLFANPAVRQWQFANSLTGVGVSYDRRTDHGTIGPQKGCADYNINGGADTYTKYRTSTLWGHGRYSNGRTDDVMWCENSDADLLYPYLSADSIGGDLQREVYSFAGGYADHRGRWAWGGQLSYLAKLEYREVDPRPRNVCGTLDASLGAAYRLLPQHWLSLGIELGKYKQSNDIEFKSEMGSDKIFHLTGPAESYQRFDGAADAARYDGYRYGASLSLYPQNHRGVFAGISLSRFTFDCILTDLNRLPMASLWHNALQLRAGWLGQWHSCRLAVYGQLEASRRHGTENLFGDPASNVYPQIGSIEMFGRNVTGLSGGLSAAWQATGTDILRLYADGGWQRTVTAYVEPRQYERIKYGTFGARLQYDKLMGRGWLLSVKAGLTAVSPGGCEYIPGKPDAELAGLERINRHVYELESQRQLKVNAGLTLVIPVWSGYAVQLGADWRHHDYHGPEHSDTINTSLAFVF